jgi:drug/metabolite transporter (DMT)-like permease
MSYRNGVLLAIGVVAVSFSAIFIRIADAPSLTIALYRNAFSAAILLPILLTGRRKELRELTRNQFGIAFLAGAMLALHFAVWISSLSYTTVAASVVLVTASPIFVAMGSRALFGEQVARGAVAGILVGLAGAVIVSGGDFAVSGRAAGGDGLALAGALAAAGYFLAGRRLRQDVSLLTYVGLVYAITAVLLFPPALVAGVKLTGFSGKTWSMFVLQALVPQMLGHTIFNYLLKDMDATTVAIAILGEPIGSTLLAMAFFQEIPPWTAVLGGVLILAGIYAAVTSQARGRRGRPQPIAVPME